ncbi:Myosin-10 [Yarrowia sp. B02]|nr:Myosin-10 [Yarrowia sp. B02]
MGLIATILAVCWLLHRATRLLKIPATTLIRLLGVDIPERPEICVDHVSDSSVTLRWPKPEKTTAHKHIIEVNGIKAGESSRSTSVVLTNLQPDKTYSVNVLTVNANQYRSNTTTVRVHTRKRTQHPSFDSLAPLLMDPVCPSFVVLASGSSSSVSPASTSVKKKHRKSKAYTVEALSAEVEAAQGEIREANVQYREVEKELVAMENKLQEELADLRAQRKKDDVQRQQLRSEMKALEDQKVNIELHRAKVDKQLLHLEQTLRRMEVEQSKWLNTSAIMERKTEDLATTEKETYHENANKKLAEAESLHKSLASVEEEVKSMTAEARQLDTMRKSLAESSPEALLKTLDGFSDGKAEILRQQIHFDADLDLKWREVQRQLEQRYVQVYGEYGEATRLLEAAKIQYQQFQVASANSSQLLDNSSSFDFSREAVQPDRRPSAFETDDNFNTAVQMFLPSNLFGADDLNDSLTQSSFEAIDELPKVSYPQAQTSSPSSSFDAFRVSSEDLDTSSPVTRKRLSGMFGFNRKQPQDNKGSLFFRKQKEKDEDESFDPFQASWNRSSSPGGIFGPSFGTSEWSGSPAEDWSSQSVGSPFAPGFKPFEQPKELYDEPHGASSTHSEHSVMTDGSKDSAGRESIIQKGIRTLTSPRKGSVSSAKFNVGKLSFFKKDRSDASEEEEEPLGAIRESRSGTGSPHLNMEEFLKQT